MICYVNNKTIYCIDEMFFVCYPNIYITVTIIS